ncbi:MAG: tetratricopeptide repeat protein [Opitutaceae bacterium]|jgi:hypothetical protein
MLKPVPQASAPVARVIGVAVLAALVAIFLFSPNFNRWRALGTAFILPEVARADDALRQLQNPFVHIDNYTNRVLQWRLFFPLVGHALGLSPAGYLALPFAGCLLVLIFIVRLTRKRGFDWSEAFAMAMLLATCSWFFVSTGWLGVFDSWYVLGLLLVVFADDLGLAAAATLIAPWIDERFVIMLPLGLALRWQYQAVLGASRDDRPGRRELGWLGVALLPWLAIRLGTFLAGHDPVAAGFVRDMPAHQFSVGAKYYFLGLWHGIRWGWIFAAAWMVLAWRQGRGRVGLWALFLGTLAINLFIAEDLSRSVSTLVPVIVLGALWLKHRSSPAFRPALFGACALNLVFPAAHIVGGSVAPIRNYYFAWQQGLPTGREAAAYYNLYADRCAQEHRAGEALLALNLSLAADPELATTYLSRAAVYAGEGKLKEALVDADKAVTLAPRWPAAWFNRGRLRAKTGDVDGALADLDQALRLAPADWPQRAEARSTMENLRLRTLPPGKHA